ncbi:MULTISPECIES: hypothetical protein [Salimicrobium]|uniref:YtxH-like protein n=2 Tax=Salimicrobium TaxID=351195 RepID=A0ABY1KS06_9BACI|nr:MULTISPECIES: hypothetical protein [Salimicrobium]SDX34764.1 hypothetical protein SAMN04488081_0243 [Salimicrobium album]SIS60927.1 hypothetical protein SAMN05421758_1038 [Salimicrobium salexigens]
MRKRWKLALAGAITGGAAAYLMYDEERRTQMTSKVSQLSKKSNDLSDMPIQEAGEPEADNLQNSKMVSEGSQFGVQYYNELTEKEREILEKSRDQD